MKTKKKMIIVGSIIIIIIIVGIIAGKVVLQSIEEKKNEIENIIKEGKTAVIYVENSDQKKCENCKKIKKHLDSKKINYVLYDTAKYSESEYKKMLQSLEINPNDFSYPGIIYVENGKVYSDRINISEEKTVDEFIKEYDLEKVK